MQLNVTESHNHLKLLNLKFWHGPCLKRTMHDVVTVTLIILAVALLRRHLLTDPDAAPGVRSGEDQGFPTPVRVAIPVDRPHSTRRARKG